MRTIRVHVDAALTAGEDIVLPEAASAHVLRVLRLRAGAQLTLFNGRGGEYRGRLLEPIRKSACVTIEAHHAIERESGLEILLLQGISRGERMDLVVQKATELGVTRIVPVNTEFSVVKLDAATIERKRAHWQAIAIGACEQSGRNRIPHIEAPCELSTALQIAAAFAPTRLVLDAEAKLPLASLPRTTTQAALLIGPEGGLSDKEIRHAGSAGFESRSIGPRILRTETAALTALAVLQSVAGDFR